MSDNKINLFYFNHKITSPIVFFIIQVNNDNDERLIEKHTNYFFEMLIRNKLADATNILVFNVIKQHSGKMINWILPSKNSNGKIVQQIEHDQRILNTIIGETIKNTKCETLFLFSPNELKIQDCNINLNFLVDIYEN